MSVCSWASGSKTGFPPHEAPSSFSAVNSTDSAGEGRAGEGFAVTS